MQVHKWHLLCGATMAHIRQLRPYAFRPGLLGKGPQNLFRCSLCARKRSTVQTWWKVAPPGRSARSPLLQIGLHILGLHGKGERICTGKSTFENYVKSPILLRARPPPRGARSPPVPPSQARHSPTNPQPQALSHQP